MAVGVEVEARVSAHARVRTHALGPEGRMDALQDYVLGHNGTIVIRRILIANNGCKCSHFSMDTHIYILSHAHSLRPLAAFRAQWVPPKLSGLSADGHIRHFATVG